MYGVKQVAEVQLLEEGEEEGGHVEGGGGDGNRQASEMPDSKWDSKDL